MGEPFSDLRDTGVSLEKPRNLCSMLAGIEGTGRKIGGSVV